MKGAHLTKMPRSIENVSQGSLPFVVCYLIHPTQSLAKNEQYLFGKFVHKSLFCYQWNLKIVCLLSVNICDSAKKTLKNFFILGGGEWEEVLYLCVAETSNWKMKKKQNNTNK